MKRIAVTGASGGIGRAVAVRYAGPDTHIDICARNTEELALTADICRRKGAVVRITDFDMRNKEALLQWTRTITEGGELDCLLCCAGVSSGVHPQDSYVQPEYRDDLIRELEVNAVSSILCVNEAVTRMQALKMPEHHFQVGMVASLAAMTGLPGSPGYSASKAAVRVYGEALRRLVADDNIGVTVILPGFVESSMSRRYQGAKPSLISAEKAAEIIVKALERNSGEVAFPTHLAWGIRLLNCLPECLQPVFLKGFFFTVEPDAESRRNEEVNGQNRRGV